MKLTFTEAGWADYLWFQQNDKKLLKKINTLIKDIQRNPALQLEVCQIVS